MAAVSTTRFMMSPTPPTPSLENSVTNGLSPEVYDVDGSSSASSSTEPQ